MDRAAILLLALAVCLLGDRCRCDPAKIGNSASLTETKVVGNKGAEVEPEEETVKKPGENKTLHDKAEKEPVKNLIVKEEKEKEADKDKPKTAKGNGHGEECDASSSESCKLPNGQIVACLKVPGSDPPTFSLMVQNKGASPVNISVSAPKSVKLTKTLVSLLPRQDEKVQFSYQQGITNDPISLVIGDWKCNLSFHEKTSDSKEENMSSSKTFSSGSFLLMYAPIGLILIFGVVYMVIRLKRRHIQEQKFGYQKLETTLPVSAGGVQEVVAAEGWDNSWDDNWDDEEAPMTPLTPSLSLSSKGLASRKSNKEGWRD